MKAARGCCVLALLLAPLHASATAVKTAVNPVQKVVQLLSDLQAKIIKEGEGASKTYDEFSEFCEDRSREIRTSIKTLVAQKKDLEAIIEKASDEMESLGTKVEELSTAISIDESDLRAARLIREKEEGDFVKMEKDLLDTIDMIERSIAILERDLKGGGSFSQLQGIGSIEQTFSVMVEAGGLASADTAKLTALLQSSSDTGDEDTELGAPDPEAYQKKSGTIIETMEALLDKAETSLEETRKSEQKKTFNYNLLKQSLDDKVKTAKKNMDDTKKDLAEAGERKGTAEGDVSVTEKALKADKDSLSELHHDCMSKASDFEEEMKSRAEELDAIAKAKQVIVDMAKPAEKQSYDLGQVSFLQVEDEDSGTEGSAVDIQAAHMVKQLARQTRSASLTQLASRMDAVIRAGAGSGADPFAKVKALLEDMITRLTGKLDEAAEHKAWCDKEMSETKARMDEKEGDVEKLTTKLDQLSAESARHMEDIAELQKELAELATSQAEMDKIRQEEHGIFAKSKPEMEDGIKGVKTALKVLRDYYAKAKDDAAHNADTGGGAAIIGLLQVVESDFSKTLSELISEEDASQKLYEDQTKENEVTRVTKEQDVKYKTKNSKANDKASAELSTDRDSVQAELDAVKEYFGKLQEQCVAKAEPYEEAKKRKENEIAGLKEALGLLEGGAMFLQEGANKLRHHLRGIQSHA